MAEHPWPEDIALNATADLLTVRFDSGEVFAISAELLRVESPSAEVQGHGSSQKQTPWGKRQVTITAIRPVGNYAVRLVFSDGHDSGLFTWETLYRFGCDGDAMMQDYCNRLDALGRSRDA